MKCSHCGETLVEDFDNVVSELKRIVTQYPSWRNVLKAIILRCPHCQYENEILVEDLLS